MHICSLDGEGDVHTYIHIQPGDRIDASEVTRGVEPERVGPVRETDLIDPIRFRV